MENIILAATETTPQVTLDFEKNILLIKGVSYPENSNEFYKPIINWLKEYLNSVDTEIILNLHIEYLNTSSTKSILNILDVFNDSFNEGKNVKIIWNYDKENQSLFECGEELSFGLDVPFEIVSI